MATRSRIGYFDGKGIYHVYCHFDGYPEGVGKTLVENDKEDDAKKLIMTGDVRFVPDDPENIEHDSYFNITNQISVAQFILGKNVDGTVSISDKCFPKKKLAVGWAEYFYVFNPLDGEWYVYDLRYHSPKGFHKVSEILFP